MKIVKKKLSSKKKKIKQSIYKNQSSEYIKMQMFTKIQMIRYGYYRRSDLKKDKVKKIIYSFNSFLKNINSSDPLVVSMKSLTKLFIGEIIDISKQVMFEVRDSLKWIDNPINLKHIYLFIEKSFGRMY